MKRIIRSLFGIILIVISTITWAQYKEPLLVMDMANASRLPKNFRMSSQTLPANINTTGLAELHIAGGAQFSKSAFERILNRLHVKKLMIIDLRQESHGFLNGNAVSWYAPNNAINQGKDSNSIEASQAQLLANLGQRDIVDVYTILSKENGYITKAKPTPYAVHQVMSEQEFVSARHQDYQRVYVQDFHAPSQAEVDRFIKIVKELPSDEWVYFHCRAGVGRTTTFMAMVDIMHNAKRVSLDDILTRQAALGGKDLRKISNDPNKRQASIERYEFIKKFYACWAGTGPCT